MIDSSKDKKDILSHFLKGGGISKILHQAKRIENIIYQQVIILHFEEYFIEKYGNDLDRLKASFSREGTIELWNKVDGRAVMAHPLDYVDLHNAIGVTEFWYPSQEKDFYVSELRWLKEEDNYKNIIEGFSSKIENCAYLELQLKDVAFERLATEQLKKCQINLDNLRKKYYDNRTTD